MAQLVRGKTGLIEALNEQKQYQEYRLQGHLTKAERSRVEIEVNLYTFIASWLEGVTLLTEAEYDEGFKKWMAD